MPAPAAAGPAGSQDAHGRSIDIPTDRKIVVGSRPTEVDGTIVFQDVTAAETRRAGPGEEVELPASEVRRLTELGFLTTNQTTNGKERRNAKTGVKDDSTW